MTPTQLPPTRKQFQAMQMTIERMAKVPAPPVGWRTANQEGDWKCGEAMWFNEITNRWQFRSYRGHFTKEHYAVPINWRAEQDTATPAPTAAKCLDMVNAPPHYNAHPSGVECITITEHMSFNLGNAIKYVWRADSKGSALEDLRKAQYYLAREIAKRESAK